ncbi:YhcN/YlaJ family sporulation lipoprotein [Viridibacillus sp. YIM B01967]|uniref:YhcN/YlaJ family sporulation lipoprotein n=1 Tax=Viridibacillus soli TaxID=2798301 RepID=A0ABS1H608_9BACL|nr:YhcN/YlaJ family sporulation lipoprotein [Viridibacillus soli]MBK3494721.1 YhcN/YlaJ family sporulation lipoprotein [Viridibacillus soli]
MSKLLQISLAALLISSLAGCGANKKVDETVKNDTETNVTENRANESTNNTETPTEKTPTTNHENKIELADDVADKITEMEEVESANVLVTNKNAYVAIRLKEGVNGNKQIEDKIADQARATNANFKNVYVSLNPDFVKQMNEYGEKVRANEPVEGFFNEFSNTVKRVFPNAH